MSSVQHSLFSPLFCPLYRLYCLLNPYNEKFTIINISCYLPNVEGNSILRYYRYLGHRLYPLYWCNNKEVGDESLCHACTCKEIGTTYYFCDKCGLSFHKECVESPPLIKSLYHSKHPLQLVLDYSGIYCSHCESRYRYKDVRLYYYCFTCKFSLHPVCATRPSFLNYPKRHEHDLNIFSRKADLTCDVCGVVDSKLLIYVCLQCDFVVHENCIYLPFVIRISRHDHRLSFTYSLPRILSCGVCRQKVDEDYGSYSCTKDCSYAVHSKCATREDVWDGKELEEEPEEDYENLNSFEVIGDGIIKHFGHSHHMKFERKTTDIMYDDEKRCQACLLPFYGGGVYECMESNCDFVLHEACANLPRTKQHIAHPNPFILQVSDTKNIFLCEYCQRCLYGFRYVCSKGDESISIDVRCAAISEPFVQQCHPHPLFLSNELGKSRLCSICKNEKDQTLNCIECSFFLCFRCATLPYKVRYEHDEHFLTLSYKENESLNWCEICEEIMDSTIWLYTCHECGTVFHIQCFLGKCAPYVKPAQNLLLDDTKFNIIPNNRLTRPICDDCGRRCQDKLMLEVYDDDRKMLYCYRHCLKK
ncbi:PREDICTED: uncharacterized protein LOC106326578 [Brassica oleracea var. oleracea]|uniref:uncharacterized protein LOC106326578 n=1 Tax=Brassica oleracea var. oleracea TaxID=109376 RepID=UPI0006A73EAC|nr:PREDICTED: uncharacterized protein LOC106326578 [Brassica oleracea var. oleracea]